MKYKRSDQTNSNLFFILFLTRMDPRFRRGGDGCASLFDSEEAKKIKGENRLCAWVLSLEKARESARLAVLQQGGDPNNEQHLLGQHQLQFGIFRGQTFKWLAENALGYAGYLIASMSEQSGKSESHNNLINKRAFHKYISHYPEGLYATDFKKEKICTATAATYRQTLSSSKSLSPSRAVFSLQLSTSSQHSSVPVSSL